MRGDQEVRAQRHRLPRHHKQVRIVSQNDHRHRGKKHMVVQSEQSRCGAFAGAEISSRESRDSSSGQAQHQQKESGQRIQTNVEGKIGQSQRKNNRLRHLSGGQKDSCNNSHSKADQRTDREKNARNKANAARPNPSHQRHYEPRTCQRQHAR